MRPTDPIFQQVTVNIRIVGPKFGKGYNVDSSHAITCIYQNTGKKYTVYRSYPPSIHILMLTPHDPTSGKSGGPC
jgi:hypothetical protein